MAKNEHKADDGNVELDFDNYEETEIELKDTKEEVSPESAITVEEVPENPKEEVLSVEDEHAKEVSNSQKRINQLTRKMREAERQREEAISYAQAQKRKQISLKAALAL